MRNTDPLICPRCPWSTPAFRRASNGVGVSNLTRLRDHVTAAHEPIDLDAPWEPRTFAVGDRVVVTKQPECRACEDLDFAIASGVVIGVDRSIDAPDDRIEPWRGSGPDPAENLRGHYYCVQLDQPIRDLGMMSQLMQLIRGRDYWTDEILCAATELTDAAPMDSV